jgi:hypothetical protein
MIKALGNWVIIKPESNIKNGIAFASMDSGKVISCLVDKDIEGFTVRFDINKVVTKIGDNWVVDYSDVFGVVE